MEQNIKDTEVRNILYILEIILIDIYYRNFEACNTKWQRVFNFD